MGKPEIVEVAIVFLGTDRPGDIKGPKIVKEKRSSLIRVRVRTRDPMS